MGVRAAQRGWVMAVVLVAAFARAQTPIPTFDLERFAFNPGARETLTTGSGDHLEARRLRASFIGHYQHRPLVFTVDDQVTGAAVSHRLAAHLLVAYGLFERIELGLHLPLILFQAGDDLTALGVSPVASFGVGAPVVHGRVGVLRQGAGVPVDLGIAASVAIPVGSPEALARDAELGVTFHPRLGAGHSFGAIRLGGELGVLVRGNQVLSPTSSLVTDEVGSQFTFSLAVSTTRALSVFRGELGLRGSAPFTRSTATAELLAGVRASFLADDQLEVFLVGGPGLGQAPGTPALRLMLGLAWTPSFAEKPVVDSDGDGVADENDRCPTKPGPGKRGCPATDGDADGVEDFLDACPNEPGEKRLNGCPKP